MIETTTLNDAAAILREHGLKISNIALAAGLESGAFPFGSVIRSDQNKQRIVFIYTRLLKKWIEEREV